jgi:hypothetical protein
MNVEIGTAAAQFLVREHINQNFFAVYVKGAILDWVLDIGLKSCVLQK